MSIATEVKIIVGLSIKEWKEKDISELVKDYEDDFPSEDIYKLFEMDMDKFSLIVPHEYENSEDDVVVGFPVFSSYGSAKEIDFLEINNLVLSVLSEFKEYFGFDGKVYLGSEADL